MMVSQNVLAQANPADEMLKTMRPMIGSSFWISNPAGPVGVEFCPSPKDRFNECRRLVNTAFRVESVVPAKPFPMLSVKLEDGRHGFIGYAGLRHFHAAESDTKARDRILSCEKNGPSIGMVAQAVRDCWGDPLKVNTTLTASVRHEQWVFRQGFVYLDDGVVSAIQTTR